jgi:outer membrane immunogenic protein
MKKIITTALTLLGTAQLAHAADLPRRYQEPAPYYAAPTFTWAGFYTGINGGVGFGRFTRDGDRIFGDNFGGLIGGTVGYNFQTGPVVAGFEADLDWAKISTNNNGWGYYSSGSVSGVMSLRARLGYSWDRALIFATGGYSGAWVKGNVNNALSSPNYFASQTNYLNGFVIGAGVEYAFTQNISGKAEYLYHYYGADSYFSGTPGGMNSGVYFSTVKAGINYHF